MNISAPAPYIPDNPFPNPYPMPSMAAGRAAEALFTSALHHLAPRDGAFERGAADLRNGSSLLQLANPGAGQLADSMRANAARIGGAMYTDDIWAARDAAIASAQMGATLVASPAPPEGGPSPVPEGTLNAITQQATIIAQSAERNSANPERVAASMQQLGMLLPMAVPGSERLMNDFATDAAQVLTTNGTDDIWAALMTAKSDALTALSLVDAMHEGYR